jgi:Ser/Thr protein kinase RdoA (MazF antagonist)
MLSEPDVDRECLARRLAAAYGIVGVALEFVPLGFEAACYTVEAAGRRHFLKAWPATDPADDDGRRLLGSLKLARALEERLPSPRVAGPLRARDGEVWDTGTGFPFAVFPYIDGWSPPDELPPNLAVPFGTIAAQLHGATGRLRDVLPVRDPYWTSAGDLAAAIERLRLLRPRTNPTHARLVDLVLPRAAPLLQGAQRLGSMEPMVRSLPSEMVLCHGDLGGGNLIVGVDDQLWVLDWDWAAAGPREHDLWPALGPAFPAAVEAYRRAGQGERLHLQQFEFFLLRRCLFDLLARVERLLERTSPEDDDDELLEGIDAFGFARLNALDDTVREIAAAL